MQVSLQMKEKKKNKLKRGDGEEEETETKSSLLQTQLMCTVKGDDIYCLLLHQEALKATDHFRWGINKSRFHQCAFSNIWIINSSEMCSDQCYKIQFVLAEISK